MSDRCQFPQISQYSSVSYGFVAGCHWLKKKKKKKTQWQSCELSFIWGQIKTIAQETAFQITLRNCSRVIGRRSVYTWSWWRGSECHQAHFFFFLQKISVSSSVGKESACNAGDLGSIPGLGKIAWRRKWQPTTVFLPGESYGQGSLAGYRPWGCKSQTRLSTILFFAFC